MADRNDFIRAMKDLPGFKRSHGKALLASLAAFRATMLADDLRKRAKAAARNAGKNPAAARKAAKLRARARKARKLARSLNKKADKLINKSKGLLNKLK